MWIENVQRLGGANVGVGFKPEHAEDALAGSHGVNFFEVHAENYMGEGGRPHRLLTELRSRYPLSLHGVALSIGASGPLDREHLARLKRLIDRYEPALFSEHLAWSTHDGVYFNDLLPLRRRRLPALRTISTRRKRNSACACCSRIHRPTLPSTARR